MAVVEVSCPDCDSLNVVRYGKQPNGAQRFICQNSICARRVFLLNYQVRPNRLESKHSEARQKIIDLALEGADVEETATLLKLPIKTVMEVFQVLSRFSIPPRKPLRATHSQQRAMAG